MAPSGFIFASYQDRTDVFTTQPTLTISAMHYGGEMYPKGSKHEALEEQKRNRAAAGIMKAQQTFAKLRSKRKKK